MGSNTNSSSTPFSSSPPSATSPSNPIGVGHAEGPFSAAISWSLMRLNTRCSSAKWPSSTMRSASSTTRNLNLDKSLNAMRSSSSSNSQRRPGVATTTCTGRTPHNWRRCFCSAMPPTMVTISMRAASRNTEQISFVTEVICMASSRVGAMMMAWGHLLCEGPLREVQLRNMDCSIGKTKANVLPDPVSAAPTMSFIAKVSLLLSLNDPHSVKGNAAV
mmetsp:Transcript_11005/g.16569  ORF Transcript_11005/g.16569 Transcript_11005/m.16569 type:complete len:218 (+) Transcript_11005:1330-1983(+)